MCSGFSYISLLKAETAEQRGGHSIAGGIGAEVSITFPRRIFYVQKMWEDPVFIDLIQCQFEILSLFLFTELQKIHYHFKTVQW